MKMIPMMRNAGLAVLALTLMASLSNVLADNCEAEIRGKLARVEPVENATMYVAAVEVDVREDCAEVEFELVVTETTRDGKEITNRVPRKTRVRSGTTATMKLNYRLPDGNQIKNNELKVTSCKLCGTRG